MLTQFFLGNFKELVRPLYKALANRGKDKAAERSNKDAVEAAHDGALLDQITRQSQTDDYDIFDDYNEMMIQFGYITMFSVVNPLVPGLAFLNNILEAKTDCFKICVQVKRPTPKHASHIGIAWTTILTGLSIAGVLFNLLILALSSVSLDCLFNGETKRNEIGDEAFQALCDEVGVAYSAGGKCVCAVYSFELKLWVVLIFALFALTAKSFVHNIVGNVEKKVEAEIEQEEFVKNYVFNQQAAAEAKDK